MIRKLKTIIVIILSIYCYKSYSQNIDSVEMSINVNRKNVLINLENKSSVNKYIYNPIYKTLPMQFFNLQVINLDSSFVSCNFPHYSSQSVKLLIRKNKIK